MRNKKAGARKQPSAYLEVGIHTIPLLGYPMNAHSF